MGDMEIYCSWPFKPAVVMSRARSWVVRKSSLGDESQPIFSTAGETSFRVNFLRPADMASSSENTAFTVASELKTCDHTRWFVSD